MTRTRWSALLLLCCCACGSVAVPVEQFYRIELSPPAGGELPTAGVLRVQDLQLGNALASDHLCVIADGVRVESHELQRWVAPLDRLVTDALVLGLARTQMFRLVLGAGDGGGEELALAGRVVDFACVRQGSAMAARACLQLWLCRGELLLFRGEFSADVPVEDGSPAAAVKGLSLALARVQDQLVSRMRAEHVFAGPLDAAPGK